LLLAAEHGRVEVVRVLISYRDGSAVERANLHAITGSSGHDGLAFGSLDGKCSAGPNLVATRGDPNIQSLACRRMPLREGGLIADMAK